MQKITRSFKFYTITYKQSQSLEVLKTETTTQKPKQDKLAIKFIKETKRTDFVIEIQETEELREMPVESFLEHSKIVEK